MAGGIVCAVCGNEVGPAFVCCPHCNSPLDPVYDKGEADQFRVVNLERGMPVVSEALKRFERELESARLSGCRALVLIHGYGSSGTGGAIRDAVRGSLQLLVDRKSIHDFLPGEECGKRSGPARQTAKRFPFLKGFTRQSNPGITLVVI